MVDILEFTKDDWDDDCAWEANYNDIIVKIDNQYGYLKDSEGNPTYQISIALPHQCDNWDIADGLISDLTKVKSEFDEFITDLQKVQTYLDSDEFKTFLEKEILNG